MQGREDSAGAETVRVPISHASDSQVVASTAKASALGWGLGRPLALRVAVVAAELASNVVYHGGGVGVVVLRRSATRVSVTAEDRGPGVLGTQPQSGLGIGWKVVEELSDACCAKSRPGGGLTVEAAWDFRA